MHIKQQSIRHFFGILIRRKLYSQKKYKKIVRWFLKTLSSEEKYMCHVIKIPKKACLHFNSTKYILKWQQISRCVVQVNLKKQKIMYAKVCAHYASSLLLWRENLCIVKSHNLTITFQLDYDETRWWWLKVLRNIKFKWSQRKNWWMIIVTIDYFFTILVYQKLWHKAQLSCSK